MDRRWAIRRRARLSVAAVAVVVALCALLPAAAAANTTSLTLVASPVEIPYNGTSILTGTFMDTTSMTAVGGLPILVQSGPSDTGPWTDVVVISTLEGVAAYYSGTYTLVVAPRDKTFYRMRFIGATGLDAADSPAVSVTPKVYLSKPKVPARVRHGQRFTVLCYLQPRHAPRLTNVVKFRFYRYINGAWKYKFSRWGETSNYLNFTKVTKRVTITRAGKWRVLALAPADALHASSPSRMSTTITVR